MAKEAAATDSLFEEPKSASATPRARTWRRFRRHKMALAGAAFILLVVSLAALAPVITPHSPTDMQEGRARDAPTTEHLLGLDGAARDIWARLLYGGRVSLSVGIVAVSISVLIALILGTLSGYYGGTVDMIIMRFTDIMMVFPGLILIMTVVAVLGPNIWNVMAVIGLHGVDVGLVAHMSEIAVDIGIPEIVAIKARVQRHQHHVVRAGVEAPGAVHIHHLGVPLVVAAGVEIRG